jgi:hypothetical protein
MAVFETTRTYKPIMRKFSPLLLLISILAGCVTRLTPLTAEPSPSVVPYTQCAWSWATQSLPELSAKVETELDSAGLKDVTARAEAYGENCLTAEGKVDHFAAMQTDFHITLQVADLTDKQELGSLVETILVVLDKFPAATTPGPNPGYVGISFQKRSEQLNLWFPITQGETARSSGYTGVRLFEALQIK